MPNSFHNKAEKVVSPQTTGKDTCRKRTDAKLFENSEALLTVDEVAAFLGKRPQTIRNWVARHTIPFIPGRPVKFLKRSVLDWLKNQEVAAL